MNHNPTTRLRPAQQRVWRYLQTVSAALREHPELPLPSAAEISRRCGVSRGVVAQVMRRYKREGHGIGAASEESDIRDPVQTGGRREHIAERIRTDILNNVYQPGSALPPRKVLAVRYETGYRVLRDALRVLADEGLIQPSYRTFVVRPLVPSPIQATIVFLVPAQMWADETIGRLRSTEILHAVEHACQSRGLNLVVLQLKTLSSSVIRTVCRRHSVLGFVAQANTTDRVEWLWRMLAPFDKPLAIIDEFGFDARQLPANARFTRYLLGSGGGAGLEVGRFLVRMGHRAIALFNFAAGCRWCSARFDGVRRAFEESGVRTEIAEYCVPELAGIEETQRYISGMPFVRQFDKSIEKLYRRCPLQLVTTENIRTALHGLFLSEALYRRLLPQFSRALRNETTTVWLFANDTTAMMGLEFLKQQGIAAPERVSVMGFDDTPSALTRDLTTYDFDVPGMATEIVRTLLERPDDKPSLIEPPGRVVIRKTVAQRSHPTE